MSSKRSLLVGVALVVAVAGVATAQQEGLVDEQVTALLLIDIQGFYFDRGKVPLEGPVAASMQAKRLLERFRAHGWTVPKYAVRSPLISRTA